MTKDELKEMARPERTNFSELVLVSPTHPALHSIAQEVPYTKSCQYLLASMTATLCNKKGLGLAAPQIGVNWRVIVQVVDNAGNCLAFINPEITKRRGKRNTSIEGCLSYPGVQKKIKRYEIVTVKAYTHDWKPISVKLRGLFAYIAQHEIDHLNGITIMDKRRK